MDHSKIRKQIKSIIKEEFIDNNKFSPEDKILINHKDSSKNESLNELKNKCLLCKKCGLYETAVNLVFSDGNPDAGLLFIGEAPGADEDAQSKPFVGRAGKLLTATIEGLGVPRSEVYICNILKHRPPDNRSPTPLEIEACTPFLVEQLGLIKPKLIVTLGNFSTRFLLNTDEGITKIRGIIHESPQGYKVLPTYHPAAILRNPNNIEDFKMDIKKAIDFVKC